MIRHLVYDMSLPRPIIIKNNKVTNNVNNISFNSSPPLNSHYYPFNSSPSNSLSFSPPSLDISNSNPLSIPIISPYGPMIDKRVALYKTEMCRTLEETGECRYADKCQFAHTCDELRSVPRHPRYKTEICKTWWEQGHCPYGKRCCFIHSDDLKIENDSPFHSHLHLQSSSSSSSSLPSYYRKLFYGESNQKLSLIEDEGEETKDELKFFESKKQGKIRESSSIQNKFSMKREIEGREIGEIEKREIEKRQDGFEIEIEFEKRKSLLHDLSRESISHSNSSSSLFVVPIGKPYGRSWLDDNGIYFSRSMPSKIIHLYPKDKRNKKEREGMEEMKEDGMKEDGMKEEEDGMKDGIEKEEEKENEIEKLFQDKEIEMKGIKTEMENETKEKRENKKIERNKKKIERNEDEWSSEELREITKNLLKLTEF